MGEAVWITLEDITGPGWRIDPADPARSFLRAGEQSLRVDQLTGAVMTLDLVYEQLLHTMESDDRAYMAQEIEALLTVLCAMVDGPVVNAPFSTGYQRRRLPEQWFGKAAQMGIPCADQNETCEQHQLIHRLYPDLGNSPSGEAQAWTNALAQATSTPFLRTTWHPGVHGPTLAYATMQPALSVPEQARAVQQVFKQAFV